MDTRLYKKKALTFTNNEVSRHSRHAETLKARESSRFKRLSMLRNLDEENEESTKVTKREEKKKPPSRLEMLSKWKKEKEIKKKLDNKTKPFYVGGQLGKSNSNMGLSSVAQPNVGLLPSKIAKSRLVPPSSTHPTKTINTAKQQTVGASFQSSRIPYNFKLNGGKIANVTRANGVPSKNSKTFGNTPVSSATQGSLPRIAQSTKVLSAKSAPNTRSVINTTTKPAAVKSQVSALPKPTFTKQPNKPVLKTGIPSFPSNSLKGNSAQKMKNQKPGTTSASKVHEKVAPHLTENSSNKKKENCLKLAPNKLAGGKNGASNSSLQKKENENIKMHKEELAPELDLEDAASIFDCDISIINRNVSFAPSNFQFVPPAGLPDFSVDNEAFERIKEKCISRTSTPSKECKKSSTPVVEVAHNDSSLIDNVKDGPENSLVEEKLQKETGVNLPSDSENKVNEPNEQKNASILVDESVDFLLKVDLNKIQQLFAEHKRLQEEDQSNSGNYLLNESENEEPAKALADVSIDSPFNIVDLSDSDDIYTKPLESLKLDDEPVSDKDKVLNEKENNQSTKASDTCVDSPLQIIDLNKVEKISTNNELEVLQQEESINDKLLNKKENDLRIKATKDVHVDSPLKIDLIKTEKISANHELEILEEEELMNDDLWNHQDQDKYIKKKLGVHPTRASMLKNVPVLNSIAEIAEPDESTTQTPNACKKDKQTVTPSSHSKRLQQLVTVEENSSCTSTFTPRRSLRLQNTSARKCQFQESTLSPKPRSNLRRSIRLIDLNTPDKEIANSPVAKTNITADFERLTLMEPENINPHACLLDFDCSPVPKAKPKKISLLYSPEKVRKSMRRSIRGDLMSFSPNSS